MAVCTAVPVHCCHDASGIDVVDFTAAVVKVRCSIPSSCVSLKCKSARNACVCRSMSSSLHDMHTDLPTYLSQMKYYERMLKVKERQQHVQEVSA